MVNNSNLLEHPIDMLIGMDILRNHVLTFNKSRQKIIIDNEPNQSNYAHALTLNISNIMGQSYVLCIIGINGKRVRAILDSGAWISYLSSTYLDGVEAIGEIHDYNPILGEIRTSKHRSRIQIDDTNQNIEVGKMTPILEMTMKVLNVDAIIGLDSIDSDAFCIDFISCRLLFT